VTTVDSNVQLGGVSDSRSGIDRRLNVRDMRLGSLVFVGISFMWACGGGSGGSGTGGSSTGGQSGGSGGTSSSGGTTSSGGSTATGGSSTTGGTTGKGGTPGTGGENNKGGTTGTGGTTSPGGAGGADTGGAKTGGAGGKTGGSSGATGGAATGGGGGGKGGTGAGGAATGGASAGTGGENNKGGTSGGTGGGGGGGSTGGVAVNLDDVHQTIEGFGFNTALSSATPNWDTFYTTTGSGLGLSIVRVAMQSNGSLSGAVPPSSYNAKVIGSPWTAPANCKDNNSTTKGGKLLTSCYDSWSTSIANFAKNNKLYAMGAANEPDFASCGSTIGPPCNGDYDTMIFTATEMVNFVKVLGPKLKAVNVKLIAPEPSEWVHLWSNASATGSTVASHPNSSDPLKCGCFSNDPTTVGCSSTCASGGGYDYGHWLAKDATAWAAIDIIGTHEYDSQKAAPWPSDVDGGKRSKPVYETEVSGVMYWPEQGPSSDINNGVVVAGWIHSALVVGEASAWLYWWYQTSSDNEGLVLSASSMTKRAYTLGNYAKFVRPGYVMVGVTGNTNTNVLLSAYTGTDGIVIVAINKGTAAATVPIGFAGGTAPASCTPYVTSSSDNLKAGTAVTVTGGTLSASLAGTTVTSFVCK
jgi:O-glycosyl hydrolase